MNDYTNPYVVGTISESPESERAAFISKTYWHLAGAIALFAVLEGLFISMGLGATALGLLGASKYSWLMVLGAFMLVSWVAERWATNGSSTGMQYLGLLLYTVAEAVIFLPLIVMAMAMTGDVGLVQVPFLQYTE